MDLKVLKQSVSVNDCLFNQTVEQPIDLELPLPDYCPDIARVMKCKAIPRVGAKGLNGQNLSVEGTVTIHVIYCDNEGKLFSFESTIPFSKSIETGCDCDGGAVVVRAKSEYVNCRAVNSRKLDIHGAIGLFAKVICKKNAEVITDIDGGDMQLRRGMAPATTPIGLAEKNLILEEELEIGQGQPAVHHLLRYDASAITTDCKIISNKVVVKGEVRVCALYCPQEGNRPQLFESTLPFSQIIDVDGISEACECDSKVEVASLELKPRTGPDGETRTFILSSKLCISVSAFCNNDVPVVFDAFSTKYEADLAKNDVAFEKIICNIAESFQCKKTLEFSDGALGTVVDLWCETQTGATKIEDKRLCISGTVLVCLLMYDTDNHPAYQERPIDFTYQYDMQELPATMRCDPQIEAFAPSFTILSTTSMEVRVELKISAAVYDIRHMPLLTEIEVNEAAVKKSMVDSALIIYYADAGEVLWNIARKYNASPEQIMELNHLSEESLPTAKTLLIPVK